MPMHYVHKYRIALRYGGSEEGGWYYEEGVPEMSNIFSSNSIELAYETCRDYNARECERQKNEEDYQYHSVLAHLSTHFSYSVSENPIAEYYPAERPHYE